MLLEDAPSLPALDPANATQQAAEELVRGRKPTYVSYDDWLMLDQLERERGVAQRRPRIKFSDVKLQNATPA